MEIGDHPLIIISMRTPMTIRIIMILTIIVGILCLYKFHIFGIVLFLLIMFLLFGMSENSVRLNDVLDYDLLKKQASLFGLTIFFMVNMGCYVYQLENRKTINWNPSYFVYGQYDSVKYPSNGWFSGKREGSLFLESFTDALGFGFPLNDSNDPIYLKINSEESFEIRYTLSKTLLIGAIFEGKNDIDLTNIKVFFLPAASSENNCSLKLKDFDWLRKDDIKHLKFNYIQLTLYDELFVKLLLFCKLDNIVRCYYLRAI